MRGHRETIHLPSGHSFRVLRWTRNLRDVECVLAPGKAARVAGEGTHWHYHLEMELTLFTAGEGERFVGDHIGHFSPGDLVLLGEKLPHYWHARDTSAGISVQWHFPQDHPFWAFPENVVFSSLFKRAGRGVRFCGATAVQLRTELHALTLTSGSGRLAGLLRLFSLMHAAPDSDIDFLSVRSFALSTKSHYQQAIREAVRHLIANFRDEVRLDELLNLTGLSRPTFARQFKQHSGRTFSEFLNQLRLQSACRELVETDRNVLEIALASGFTQVSFFNRVFRRVMRCSPSAYRLRERRRRTRRK